MNLRYIIAGLLTIFTQTAMAQESLDWKMWMFRLTDGDQQGLEALIANNALWKTIAEDTAHTNIQLLDIDLLREHLPVADHKTLPWAAFGAVEEGRTHEFQFIGGKPLHFLEHIPESEPSRYVMETAPREAHAIIHFKWDTSPSGDDVDFSIDLTHSPLISRETVQGTSLPVGKPVRGNQSVQFDGTMTSGEMPTYLWTESDSPPIIIRLAASGNNFKSFREGKRQFALESKVFKFKGRLDGGASGQGVSLPKGFTHINGKAIAFRLPQNEPDKTKPKNKYRPSKSFIENSSRILKDFGINKSLDQLEVASTVRVVNVINDSERDRFDRAATLFKMILNNPNSGQDSGGGRNSKAKLSREFGFESILRVVGKYHDWLAPYQEVTPYYEDKRLEGSYAILADFLSQYVLVGRSSDNAIMGVETGMASVIRVTTSEDEDLYNIDYFHLNRQHDDIPNSVRDTPEALAKFDAGFRESYFQFEYNARNGETVGFFYSASPKEHYIVLNTMTAFDRSSSGRELLVLEK